MTDIKLNELVCQLESAVEDAQTSSGVSSSLSEIETAVAALRTAYDTDPATVAVADVVAARDMIQNCSFGSLASSSNEWALAEAEAA